MSNGGKRKCWANGTGNPEGKELGIYRFQQGGQARLPWEGRAEWGLEGVNHPLCRSLQKEGVLMQTPKAGVHQDFF